MTQALRICWNCGKGFFTEAEIKKARRRGACPECGGPAHNIITLQRAESAALILAEMERREAA